MSKRQTLSERFDSLPPPQYDDMPDYSTKNRGQEINPATDVDDEFVTSNITYNASRAPGNRSFRQPMIPHPYSQSSKRSQFYSYRFQSQQQSRANGRKRNTDNITTPHFSQQNSSNRRGMTRGRMWKRGGLNRTGTGTGARTGFSIGQRNGVRQPRARTDLGGDRGTRRGRGRGRGRGGVMNKRNNRRGGLTEQKLDKELEKYYANNDPEKLKEIKNDKLDRELDDYWQAPEKK